MTNEFSILIIDDDYKFASELKACLESNGYHIILIADSVEDGLNAIHKHCPNGVVLDIQLKDGLGLEILKHLKSDTGSELDPVLIVVSSYINNRIITILNKKKCLYFDKSYNYKHELVLNYFNEMIDTYENEQINIVKSPVIKKSLTDEQIKNLVFAKLNILGFDSKVTAYQYLVDAISYILNPNQPQEKSLTAVLKKVTYVQYTSAFNGINRLITTSFNQNPDLFCEFYYGALKVNIDNPIPSVKSFIYQIVDEIKKECLL